MLWKDLSGSCRDGDLGAEWGGMGDTAGVEGRWEAVTKVCAVLSRVRLSVTPGTGARQAPLSVGFSKQEYWSTVLLQGIFLTQGLSPRLFVSCVARRVLYH